jgi:alpha-L-fucosidase 2
MHSCPRLVADVPEKVETDQDKTLFYNINTGREKQPQEEQSMRNLTRRDLLISGSALAVATQIPAAQGMDVTAGGSAAAGEHQLWYDWPGDAPLNSLPLGNGRLGALVPGSPLLERIILNEDTLWAGQPHDWRKQGGPGTLAAIRAATFAGDYSQADTLCEKLQGPYSHSYAPLGNLLLEPTHQGAISDYRRALNLDQGMVTVRYRAGNIGFSREIFVSHPHQLILLRLAADTPGALSLTLRLDSPLRFEATPDRQGITLAGKAPTHCAPSYVGKQLTPVIYSDEDGKGMRFAARLEVLSTDGAIRVAGQSLRVEGAGELVLAISAATGFRGYDKAPDLTLEQVLERVREPLAAARGRGYDALRQAHQADHQSLYRRMSLELDAAGAVRDLPTDKRLAANQWQADPGLAALYLNFSRYLLIASSRPGTQAANLQGIWNWDVQPPWSSNYTTNINVQQNYWGAEAGNLAELHGPMIDLIDGLADTGSKTARMLYGLEGWCVHHNSDIWRLSSPVGEGKGNPNWANFALAGPWLARHVWEHYLYSQDRAFLAQRGYRLLKGCAEFCAGWLVRNPHDGLLTTAPSVSTENLFRGADGQPHAVSAGCTMDIAMIREIFANTRMAADILGVDANFSAKLKDLTAQLPPYRIGAHGQLQEWEQDFSENEPGHRHISHLYPLAPGNQITPRGTPELARAARVSMERRLAADGGATGWARAWIIQVFARLEDGDKALENFTALLKMGTSPALLDTHPSGIGPLFQIDGNFAGGAGLMEMLLQSHAGEIALLPALPKAWAAGGRVRGIRARGGVTLDFTWNQGKLTRAEMTASADGSHLLRLPQGQSLRRLTRDRKVQPLKREGDVWRITVRQGETLQLQFA